MALVHKKHQPDLLRGTLATSVRNTIPAGEASPQMRQALSAVIPAEKPKPGKKAKRGGHVKGKRNTTASGPVLKALATPVSKDVQTLAGKEEKRAKRQAKQEAKRQKQEAFKARCKKESEAAVQRSHDRRRRVTQDLSPEDLAVGDAPVKVFVRKRISRREVEVHEQVLSLPLIEWFEQNPPDEVLETKLYKAVVPDSGNWEYRQVVQPLMTRIGNLDIGIGVSRNLIKMPVGDNKRQRIRGLTAIAHTNKSRVARSEAEYVPQVNLERVEETQGKGIKPVPRPETNNKVIELRPTQEQEQKYILGEYLKMKDARELANVRAYQGYKDSICAVFKGLAQARNQRIRDVFYRSMADVDVSEHSVATVEQPVARETRDETEDLAAQIEALEQFNLSHASEKSWEQLKEKAAAKAEATKPTVDQLSKRELAKRVHVKVPAGKMERLTHRKVSRRQQLKGEAQERRYQESMIQEINLNRWIEMAELRNPSERYDETELYAKRLEIMAHSEYVTREEFVLDGKVGVRTEDDMNYYELMRHADYRQYGLHLKAISRDQRVEETVGAFWQQQAKTLTLVAQRIHEQQTTADFATPAQIAAKDGTSEKGEVKTEDTVGKLNPVKSAVEITRETIMSAHDHAIKVGSKLSTFDFKAKIDESILRSYEASKNYGGILLPHQQTSFSLIE